LKQLRIELRISSGRRAKGRNGTMAPACLSRRAA
jgi:hypothetical protein